MAENEKITETRSPKCNAVMCLDERLGSERVDDAECGIPAKQLVCPNCWTYADLPESKVKLTPEAVAAYVAAPQHCPYCRSGEIQSSDIDWNEPLTLKIECLDCGRTWREVLKCVDIEEDD